MLYLVQRHREIRFPLLPLLPMQVVPATGLVEFVLGTSGGSCISTTRRNVKPHVRQRESAPRRTLHNVRQEGQAFLRVVRLNTIRISTRWPGAKHASQVFERSIKRPFATS